MLQLNSFSSKAANGETPVGNGCFSKGHAKQNHKTLRKIFENIKKTNDHNRTEH